MLDELKRHNDIVQERIMKSFGYSDTEDFIQKGEDEIELIQKGEIDYDWDLEKAVYADTAQNRRLNRVGQEYHRGRKKKNMDYGNDVGSGNNLGSQASKTDTYTLKKVANYDKAPQAMKDAAKKELQNRGDAGSKKESSRERFMRLTNELRDFFKKTGVHNESKEYHKKLKDIMEREHLNMNTILSIGGSFMSASQAMKAQKAIEKMKAEEGGGKNKVHEKVKKDTIKDITSNGAGAHDDRFIDDNPTDYYKSVMKKYGVSDVGELADKLGEEDGGYEKYDKIYSKMLRQIPASAFHKEYGD